MMPHFMKELIYYIEIEWLRLKMIGEAVDEVKRRVE